MSGDGRSQQGTCQVTYGGIVRGGIVSMNSPFWDGAVAEPPGDFADCVGLCLVSVRVVKL
jgi:hypothetical protein